ncbi:MAG TPA: TIM barrel protein [Bryobacteraceae bacterium]|nr:TIM barrel protein [Bryobacteraceae bacterium]HPT28424.1 TIM barrel protein [Bryobacteraceae bacterium]
MTRRDFAGAVAATAMQPARRSGLGLSPDCFVIARPPRNALDYLDKARSAGAAGVQSTLSSFDPAYLRQVRDYLERHGMYLEIATRLPGEDVSEFEATLKAAKECGAECIRTVCLSGRRYETFGTLDEWNAFVAESKRKLGRAIQIAERVKFAIGLENHKDWTIEEMVPLLKSYSSAYLGACIDFGNNLALLDSPEELVEALAPFVVNTHIKDIAVREYADGFLMAEVALGTGIVDLARCVSVIRKVKPRARFSLDMLTRDPLEIPCLTDKYWVTFPEAKVQRLTRALNYVRRRGSPHQLAAVSSMDGESQLKAELGNVTHSVAYARDSLGIYN